MNPWTIDDPVRTERIRDIVIVGGGTAGWMTAAILARSLPMSKYTITLVEPAVPPADLDSLDGGETSLPPIHLAHSSMGLDPGALLQLADATFSLGTEFSGFGTPDSRYFHAFGQTGLGVEGVAFHNQWERLRRAGQKAGLDEYSLGAVAARLGRFAPPSDDPRSVRSTYDFAWNWNGAGYRDLLRRAAERAGVRCIAGDLADVEMDPESGFIRAVTLAGGEQVGGDLFFDCTGAEGRLIEGELNAGFEDWSRWLPCDSAVAVRAPAALPPAPYRSVEAETSGWHWRIPLRTTTGFGHVYSSAFVTDEEAQAQLLARIGDPTAEEPGHVRFRSGRRGRMWVRNCIAVGAAACVLDPLEPTAVHIIVEGVRNFLNLMPDKSFEAGEAEEYNRLMTEAVERMRDFVILHYKANRREDSPFWKQAAAVEVPALLAHKMQLFETRGMIQLLDEEIFTQSAWAAVYFGQDMPPAKYDPLADVEDAAQAADRLQAMRTAIRSAAEAMPTHLSFIEAGLATAQRG